MPINTAGEVDRNLLVCAVDVSDGQGAPVWEIQGYKTEDSSIEISVDEETMTDILGQTHNTVNKMESSQSFDPNTLRSGAKLSEMLFDRWRNNQLSEFSNFKVLTIYAFLGTPGAYEADMWDNCTIRPTRIGGSSRVEMPFDILYGGERQTGTASDYKGAGITFSPAARSVFGSETSETKDNK